MSDTISAAMARIAQWPGTFPPAQSDHGVTSLLLEIALRDLEAPKPHHSPTLDHLVTVIEKTTFAQ